MSVTLFLLGFESGVLMLVHNWIWLCFRDLEWLDDTCFLSAGYTATVSLSGSGQVDRRTANEDSQQDRTKSGSGLVWRGGGWKGDERDSVRSGSEWPTGKDSDSERRGVRQSVVRLIVFDLAGQHFIALALASSLRTSVETAGVLVELPEGRLLAFGTDNSQVT